MKVSSDEMSRNIITFVSLPDVEKMDDSGTLIKKGKSDYKTCY